MFTRAAAHHRRSHITSALVFTSLVCFFAAVSSLGSPAVAQGAGVVVHPAAQSSAIKPGSVAPAVNSAALKTSSKPTWQELSPSQQLSLRPLAPSWDTLAEARKRKWIAIAANYPNLAPEEQTKLHSRMTEWASLSTKQRDQARLNFAASKQLSPDQKTATWEAYQALSPEEKKKLATSAAPKIPGAAAATKPVSPVKLATVPLTKEAPKQMSKLPAVKHAVNKNTLLPQPPIKPASAPNPKSAPVLSQ